MSVEAAYQVLSPAPGVVLIAGKGLMRSIDGGQSFLSQGPAGTAEVTSIARFANGSLACAANRGALDTRLYFSTDAGATWAPAQMPSLAISRVTLAATGSVGWGEAANRDQVLPGLLHSTDAGRSWQRIESPSLAAHADWLGQGWYNQALAVDARDSAHVALGARGAAWTLDGGVTWTAYYGLHPDIQAAAWLPSSPPALLIGSDGGLALLRDPFGCPGCIEQHNEGVASHLVYQLDAWGGRIGAGLQDNGCVQLDAGRGTATQLSGGDGNAVLYHRVDPKRLLFSSNGEIYSTPGRGPGSGIPGLPYPIGIQLIPDPSDPTGDTVYTIATGHIYRSRDFGRSWAALPGAGLPAGFTPVALAVDSSSGTLVAFLGLSGYRSMDGGATWSGMPSLQGHAGIGSGWLEGTTVYAASYSDDPSSNRVWELGSRGWKPIDATLPALPVYKVRADPLVPWVLWVATEIGVYRSGDGGATWARFGDGLPWVRVTDLAIEPDDSMLRVSTFGRGIWEVPLSRPTEPAPPAAAEPPQSQSCASANTGALLGLLPLGAWLRRRRGRAWVVAP